jgi:polyisoprenoid-binding protein YceI
MKHLFILITVLFSAFQINAQTLAADVSKSKIIWTANKIVGGHTGAIKLQSGNLSLAGNIITGGTFVIDMKSISCSDITDKATNAKLIGHLQSDDFFSVIQYPTATLTITERASFLNNTTVVKGNLTIKGITKPISFTATRNGKTYTAKIPVNRTLYGITYGSGSFFENLGDNAILDEFILDVTLIMK